MDLPASQKAKRDLSRKLRAMPGFVGIGLVCGDHEVSILVCCEDPEAEWASSLQREGYGGLRVGLERASPGIAHSVG